MSKLDEFEEALPGIDNTLHQKKKTTQNLVLFSCAPPPPLLSPLPLPGNLNPYALDYPMCLGGSSDAEVSSPLGGVGLGAGRTIPRSQRAALKEHLHRARHGGAGGQGVYGAAGPYEPCAEDFTIP